MEEENPTVAQVLIQILKDLASLYDTQGKYSETEKLYQRALTTAEKVLGETSGWAFLVLLRLSRFYEAQGRHAEAESLHQWLSQTEFRL
jgi:tetratricopeptide (TPR) repeat protein